MIALLVATAHAASLQVAWDFEADDGGFVSAGVPGQWEWGTPSAQPGVCSDGGSCWCTHLAGTYAADALDTLTLASFPLNGLAEPRLRIAHWYDIHSAGDIAYLEVDAGPGWQKRPIIYGGDVITGTSDGWVEGYFDISGITSTDQVRLVLETDGAVNRPGWCIDEVSVWDGDIVPPSVSGEELADTQDIDGPYVFEIQADDDVSVASATLFWRDALAVFETVSLTQKGGTTWSAAIDGAPPGTTIEWRIDVRDGDGNLATLPADGAPSQFRVYLAAPTDLNGPDERVIGNEVELTWQPPDSQHPVTGYVVYRDGMAVHEAATTSAFVPLAGDVQTFEVSAIYDTSEGLLEGDLSQPLEVEAWFPYVEALVPTAVWPGDEVRIDIYGSYLQLVQDEVALDFGPDITVDDIEVEDVDHATAHLIVDDEAAVGMADLHLSSGELDLTVVDALEILDAGDRPRLVSVEPESVVQGADNSVTIELSYVPDALPLVDFGEGIIVEDTELVDNCLIADIAIENEAPLGVHGITVDDGTRILDGLELNVRDTYAAPSKNCGPINAGSLPNVWFAAFILLCWRRRC